MPSLLIQAFLLAIPLLAGLCNTGRPPSAESDEAPPPQWLAEGSHVATGEPRLFIGVASEGLEKNHARAFEALQAEASAQIEKQVASFLAALRARAREAAQAAGEPVELPPEVEAQPPAPLPGVAMIAYTERWYEASPLLHAQKAELPLSAVVEELAASGSFAAWELPLMREHADAVFDRLAAEPAAAADDGDPAPVQP